MVTLINAPGLKGIKGLQVQSPAPPMGLAYIGAYLKSKGMNYTAIDACGSMLSQLRAHPLLADTLVQGLYTEQIISLIPKNTKVFGFSCMFSHSWPLVHELAGEVKKHFPNALYVVGGEHPSAMSEQILKGGVFDVVVRGEGEETFFELINRFEAQQDWRTVDGTAVLTTAGEYLLNPPRKRVTNIDDLPWPDWDSWHVDKYIAANQIPGVKGERTIPFLANRGCPFSCTFCSNPQMWTTRYVMRSPKSIVDEMEYYHKKYQVKDFAFMDLTFVVNRRQILEFTNEILRRKLDIKYQLPAGTRSEALDDEVVKGLAASGLRNFALAPESASDEIRRVTKKKVNLAEMESAIRRVLDAKLNLCVFFVVGFPEDNRETVMETIRYVRKLARLGVHDVSISKFTPYPGSQYYLDMAKAGNVPLDFNSLDKMIDFFSAEAKSFCPALTSQELHRLMMWGLINFYGLSILYRPWRLISNIWQYFTRGVENTRYMRVFSELLFDRRRWKKAIK